MPRLFNPARWHIAALDQRGAGRSRPNAGEDATALQANTTVHLLADIERLRRHLGVRGSTVYSASWGTSLRRPIPTRIANASWC